MAERSDSGPSPTNSSSGNASSKNAPPKGNPAFRALGLPNFRLRLPSRNWMIFLTITGSWTGALLYDRRQKKHAQNKWCELVKHIAQDPLPTSSLPRRVTIYLAAPPGDSIRSAREHFVEYVKPMLVAAAMDWDVVEGRREGEVRAGLAERIRRLRRFSHEDTGEPSEPDDQSALESLRQRTGVQPFQGPCGDIVIGRHTWKEYVRGLHEGWLGPLEAPIQLSSTAAPLSNGSLTSTGQHGGDVSDPSAMGSALEGVDDSSAAGQQVQPLPQDTISSTPEGNATETGEPELQQPAPPKKPLVQPPYNTPSSYDSSPIPSTIPQELHAASPIPFPHILGFLNTPIRMYRFLNRRQLADEVGRQTASAVLAAHRPFDSSFSVTDSNDKHWEQDQMLESEERDWQKKSLVRGDDGTEKVWSEPMVFDERIAERMRRFILTSVDEDRARQIGQGSAGIPGRPTSA